MSDPTDAAQVAPFSRVVLFAAGTSLGAHLLTASRYGYHRDELYFLAAADRPEWGYVDFPPVTPMIAKLANGIFPSSLLGLRLLPAIACVLVIVLAGLIARELGARAFGQNLAAVGVLGAPVVLGTTALLSTAAFDMLWWALIIFLVTRLLRTREAKLWVGIGAVAGAAFLTKYTVLVLLAALAIAFVVTEERKWIGSRWMWIGAILAFGFALPNLLWQREQGWPTLEYLQNQDTSATADSRMSFLLEQILNPGPLAFVLVVAGAVYLVRRQDTRVLGIAALAVFAIFIATQGKSYYTAPLYPLLFAGAGVATERWIDRKGAGKLRSPRPILTALVVFALVPLPGAIPVLPKDEIVKQELLLEIRSDYPDMFGWEELAEEVDDAVAQLTAEERADAAVITANYGEAGAVDFYSRAVDRAYSGHNGYHLWGPPPADTTTVIAVGFRPEDLAPRCGDVEQVGTLGNDEGVDNFEYGRPVHICRELRVSMDDLWSDVKRYTA
ncbi:MAG: glycosyltransferase family 39 protein [Actinomycetota bacterium]